MTFSIFLESLFFIWLNPRRLMMVFLNLFMYPVFKVNIRLNGNIVTFKASAISYKKDEGEYVNIAWTIPPKFANDGSDFNFKLEEVVAIDWSLCGWTFCNPKG